MWRFRVNTVLFICGGVALVYILLFHHVIWWHFGGLLLLWLALGYSGTRWADRRRAQAQRNMTSIR